MSLKRRARIKTFFLATVALATCSASNASDIKYPAGTISAELTKNANAVKRMEEFRFKIINTGSTVLVHKYAITILNSNGDDYALLDEDYDKLQKITSISGTLYDAFGGVVKKLKPKDVSDESAVDDNSLMDDNRRKVYQFYYKVYPYTVEFEVETEYNNSLFFPSWVPQEGESFAVEQSAYIIDAPETYNVRYRSFNYKGDPLVTNNNGRKQMKWELKNLAGIEQPFSAPPWREMTTMVMFAPSLFEIEDYHGDMSSWSEFGKFVYALKKDRDVLPAELNQRIQQLISGVSDPREQVRLLYNFLQKQTRYISVQLGIGGWQPFAASYVAQKGYGDCKALTNFMFSILKAAGIKSYYTLVKAGRGQAIIEDFPSQQFNHVILCVPIQKDTMWLECTSQTSPAGYMGDFTGNRKALVIDENGGTLVSTPRYNLKENLQTRKIVAKVEADGAMHLSVDTRYGGTQQDSRTMMVNSLSKERVQKYQQEDFELATCDVEKFAYEETKGVLPELDEKLEIAVTGYATVSGRRLFIVPNILNRSNRRLDVEENRSFEYLFRDEWRDEDNYDITIPAGYKVEALPKDVTISNKFGTYSMSITVTGNRISYSRKREQFAGRFPASAQTELVKFFDDVYRADRSKLVFVKD